MTRKTEELAKNTVIITIGKICTQFLNFFLLPVFTALLTTQEYGTADLYLTYVSLLVPVLTLQLDMGIFRFLIDVRKDPIRQKELITSAFLFLVGQAVFCATLFSVVFFFLKDANLLYLLLNIIIASVVAMLQQTARGLGDNANYAVSGVLAAILQIGINIILICFMGWRTEALYIAFFFGHLVCAAYLVIKLRIFQYIRLAGFQARTLKNLLSYSLPLVPNSVSWWAIGAADRTVVAAALGASANGILAISHKFANMYSMGINIFVFPWTESAVLYFHEPDRDAFFQSVINKMIRFFLSACIGIIAIIPFIFSMVVDTQFAEAYNQIPFFMISAFFNTVVGLYSVVFPAIKKTKYIAITSILAAGISVAVDVILVDRLGLYAPAVASVVAYGIFAGIRYKDALKYVNAPLEAKIMVSGSCVLLVCLLAYYHHNLIAHVMGFLAAAVFAVAVNYDFLRVFSQKLFKHR